MECDFDAALPGAIFGKELWKLEQEGRVKKDLYDKNLKTYAVLDLGFSDDTAIWWFQVGKELRLIDCYSASGMPISHYQEVLRGKPYTYGDWLYLPHDARAKSLQTGRSIEQQFTALGWKPRIVPELGLIDGVQAARLTLEDCYFDEACREGIETLKQYQREYDEEKRCFRDKPRHDWTSHYADAFRYACLVWREEMKPKEPEPPKFKAGVSIDGIKVGVTVSELIKEHRRRKNNE